MTSTNVLAKPTFYKTRTSIELCAFQTRAGGKHENHYVIDLVG
jgi:hypothetical protein